MSDSIYHMTDNFEILFLAKTRYNFVVMYATFFMDVIMFPENL